MDKNGSLDFLFVHVPKCSSYYKPLDEYMFINYIPMGVFGLCDILNKNGFSSKIIHLGLETILDENFSIVKYITENNIKNIGFSLHWHYQSYDVIYVLQKIKKECPDTKIILGGFTASRFPEEILKDYPEIDFIIKGDAEVSIVQLLKNLRGNSKDFSNVCNCFWRKDKDIVDNSITYISDFKKYPGIKGIENPNYSNLKLLFHHEEYVKFFKIPLFWKINAPIKENLKQRISGAKSTFPLLVGKGCTVNCTFCGGGKDAQQMLFNRKKPAFMDINKVVDTMEEALKYGYESFLICFDPYPKDDTYYVNLFKEIRNRKLNCGMGFECWGLPTKKFIDEFSLTFSNKKSYIALSPETGSEEIRKKNKGFFYTNKELIEILNYIKKVKSKVMLYFSTGLPGEKSSHFKETKKTIKSFEKKYKKIIENTFLFSIQLEPASQIFENPEKYNVKTERNSFNCFYKFHKLPESNNFTYVAYSSDSLSEANGSIAEFTEYINNYRCKNFCVIKIKLPFKFLPRLICNLQNKRWQKKGFGHIPKERRVFK